MLYHNAICYLLAYSAPYFYFSWCWPDNSLFEKELDVVLFIRVAVFYVIYFMLYVITLSFKFNLVF